MEDSYIDDKIKSLVKESNEIQRFIETRCSEDPNEITERMEMLTVYLSCTARMLNDANTILGYKEKKSLEKLLIDPNFLKYPKTIQSKLADIDCNDCKFLVKLIDDQSKAISKTLEVYRTIISKAKAEMQMTGFK